MSGPTALHSPPALLDFAAKQFDQLARKHPEFGLTHTYLAPGEASEFPQMELSLDPSGEGPSLFRTILFTDVAIIAHRDEREYISAHRAQACNPYGSDRHAVMHIVNEIEKAARIEVSEQSLQSIALPARNRDSMPVIDG